jgi:hypothetical protein
MFIPREPVLENQFCHYGTQTANTQGIGGVIAYAGSVVYLDSDASNEEAIIYRYNNHASVAGLAASEKLPFGFLMQKVKTGYHDVHPTGFYMPGDLGSSDVIAQPTYDGSGNINGSKAAPAGVGHLGIWDTVHYTAEASAAIKPGDQLFVASKRDADSTGGKVTNSTINSADDATDVQGVRLALDSTPPAVARVLKGASAVKAAANIANTTLYPIRVKLLV